MLKGSEKLQDQMALGHESVVQMAWALKGDVHAEVVRQAFDDVTGRYEILHARLVPAEDGFVLSTEPGVLSFTMPEVRADGTANAEEAMIAERMRLARHEVAFVQEKGNLHIELFELSDIDWILILTASTRVADLQSLALLAQEALAAAQQMSREQDGDEEPIPYLEVVEWMNELLAEEEAAAGLTYWQNVRRAVSTVEESAYRLTLERRVPDGEVPRPNVLRRVLEDSTVRGLDGFASRTACLYAAWQALLSRYAGEPVPVNAQLDGRAIPDLQTVVGPLSKSVPVRGVQDLGMKFADAVEAVRQELEQAVSWQEYDTGGLSSPFGFAHYTQPAAVAGSHFSFEPADLYEAAGPHKLKLFIREQAESLELALYYDERLYRASDSEKMIEYFVYLLNHALHYPETAVSRLEMLSEQELESLLITRNRTEHEVPYDTVHQMFEEQVERTPDRVAMLCGGHAYTYRELNARANQLAHRLRELGVQKDTLVGVYLERTVELPPALYGVLKAGGAYVPLDPSYPEERIAAILEDADCPIVLTLSSLREHLPQTRAQVLCLDEEAADLAGRPEGNPEPMAERDGLMYIIYTSGSTGKPKGVMIEHRNAVNLFVDMNRLHPPTGGDAMLAVASISFDISVLELFWTLCSGIATILVPYDGEQYGNYDRFLDLPQQYGLPPVTMIQTTPSRAKMLAEEPGSQKFVASLRKWWFGGEAFPTPFAEKLRKKTPAVFMNMYGPTETTIYSTAYVVQGGETLPLLPLGRAVINTKLYILDGERQPVPVGVIGELYIGDLGVARGYLNRPDLTAERFLEDPFSGVPGARMYKSGDLARYWPDGTLEILGRSDDQVKIRGYRIELGEVESVLARHPGVEKCAVAVWQTEAMEKRLIGYVVAAEGDETLTVESLRSFVAEHLPAYMIPSLFVPIDEIPLTANGKTDRKRLPEPSADAMQATQEFVAPRNEVEERIAEIWSSVLSRESVSVESEFNELGGDSILALQVVSRLQSAFQIEFPLASFFSHPTVASQALLIDELIEKQLLDELDGLSEEEIARLLEEEQD